MDSSSDHTNFNTLSSVNSPTADAVTSFEQLYDKDDRKKAQRMVGFVLAIIIVLSALTASLPDLRDLNPTTEDVITVVNTGDNAWILTCTALVLLMTPGVAFYLPNLIFSRQYST